MNRGERSGERPAAKQEVLWEKLRRVGNRWGHTTPVASFWRSNGLGFFADPLACGGGSEQVHDGRKFTEGASFQLISSRKLAAAFWELHHYTLPLDSMHHGFAVPPPRLHVLNRRHHQHDPPPSSSDQPESSSNLMTHAVESLVQHHGSIDKSTHATQNVSPPSYSSSMEIAPYNSAFTPSSSVESKGRTSYCLRTSSELLKVLNRIWNMEEQHVSNMSLIKALKEELDRARSKAKDLVREQQAYRREMDELMKHIREDKLVRKSKEQDRINAAVQSKRDELEKERKLRLRSESLHRKLSRELYEAKTSLANVSKQLEKERKSRDLLEDFCDEFAWQIRDYERELRDLRQKSSEDLGERLCHDKLVLPISKSWLDERIQAKLQNGHGVGLKKPTIDKLPSNIEAFLQSKRNSKIEINGKQEARNPIFQKSSLVLNVGASTYRDKNDEVDSAGIGSKCFELQKKSK